MGGVPAIQAQGILALDFFTTVRPGDIICSGTVGTGCIQGLSRVHGAEAYPYLRPGGRVRLDGGLLGAIESRIAAGRPAHPLRPAAGG